MLEEIYVVLVDGKVRKADRGGIRTYKTQERAIKENEWFVKRGKHVQVAKFTVTDVQEVTQ